MMSQKRSKLKIRNKEKVLQMTIQIRKVQIQRMVMLMINLLRPRSGRWSSFTMMGACTLSV
jgi:hypothetical protein